MSEKHFFYKETIATNNNVVRQDLSEQYGVATGTKVNFNRPPKLRVEKI